MTFPIVPEHAPDWADDREERAERERGLEAGEPNRVDHRSLATRRDAALARGGERASEALERPAEVKLGPAASAMERRAMQEAEAQGTEYEPVTEWDAQVHEARALRERLAELGREAREEGLGRVGAGLAALRAAAGRDRERAGPRGAEPEDLRDRLKAILGRQEEQGAERRSGTESGRDTERDAGLERERDRAPEDGRSVTERLRPALDGARSAPPRRGLRTEAEEQAAEGERQRKMERGRSWGRELDDGLEL